jgi:hypothetical protein
MPMARWNARVQGIRHWRKLKGSSDDTSLPVVTHGQSSRDCS